MEDFYKKGKIGRVIYERIFELISRDCQRYGFSRELLRIFLKNLTNETPDPIGLEKLSSKIGVSRLTLQQLIDFLEQSYIIFYIYAYDIEKDKVYITGYPRKYYFTDPFYYHVFRYLFLNVDPYSASSLCVEDPEESGKLLENIVASHLRNFVKNIVGTSLLYHKDFLYFGLVKGNEFDFYVRVNQNNTLIVEVSRREKDKKGFLKALAKLKSKGILVTLEDNIEMYYSYIEIPAWIFLLLV